MEALLEAASDIHWSNLEQQPPAQIFLNARLMWDVLTLACSNDQYGSSTSKGEGLPSNDTGNGLLHWSLAPRVVGVLNYNNNGADSDMHQHQGEVVFEVGQTAVSPDMTIDTADGGQSAPVNVLASSTTPASRARASIAQSQAPNTVSTTARPPTAPNGPFNAPYPTSMSTPTSGGVLIHPYPNADALANDARNTSWLWDGTGRPTALNTFGGNSRSTVNYAGYDIGQPGIIMDDMTESTTWWDFGNL